MSKPESGFVYHCIPVTPTGDCIRPSTGYGGTFNEQQQKVYGFIEEKPPLIFASTHLTKALAYAMQGGLQEKIFCQEIDGSDNELVLACDRERMLTRERHATIYKIPNTDFQTLQERERQSVSTDPVSFNKTEIALKPKSVDDLMRAGLQILSFKESFKQLMDIGMLAQIDATRDMPLYVLLSQLMKQGIVTWENKERNLNPDPILAQKLNVPIVSVKQNIVKRKSFKPSL